MARLTPLLAVLLLAGCDSKPVTGTTTVRSSVDVTVIWPVDGPWMAPRSMVIV